MYICIHLSPSFESCIYQPFIRISHESEFRRRSPRLVVSFSLGHFIFAWVWVLSLVFKVTSHLFLKEYCNAPCVVLQYSFKNNMCCSILSKILCVAVFFQKYKYCYIYILCHRAAPSRHREVYYCPTWQKKDAMAKERCYGKRKMLWQKKDAKIQISWYIYSMPPCGTLQAQRSLLLSDLAKERCYSTCNRNRQRCVCKLPRLRLRLGAGRAEATKQ
jgi:hypothetical protein